MEASEANALSLKPKLPDMIFSTPLSFNNSNAAGPAPSVSDSAVLSMKVME
jgi:hypothetical protein